MEIIEITQSNIEEIVRLRLELWRFEKEIADFNIKIPEMSNLKEEMLTYCNTDDKKIFGINTGGRIIGYICGSIENTSEYIEDYKKTGYIEGLFIIKEARGNGFSKVLIESILDWFKGNDIHFIQIGVLANNAVSMEIYKKYGFEVYYCIMKKIL